MAVAGEVTHGGPNPRSAKSDSSECIRHASVTPRNTEYMKYDPPGAQVYDDALAQKYLLYTPPARLKRKI